MATPADDRSNSTDSPALEQPSTTRVWQACQSCRRKKVKCDGKQPCHNCSSRGQSCEFPEAKDHASASRSYASSFEARCQQMDSVCQRLEILTSELSRVTAILERASSSSGVEGSHNEELVQAASVLHSFPESLAQFQDTVALQRTSEEALDSVSARHDGHTELTVSRIPADDSSDSSDDDSEDELQHGDHLGLDDRERNNQTGALVTDSYGRLRFVGGATNKMLIDAAMNLSPAASTHTPSSGPPTEIRGLPNAEAPGDGDVEIPMFVRGRIWPELPFLPKPDQLSRPPQYVSDLLVGVYFERLHYTFPVLFKPHFMQRYARMMRDNSRSCSVVDKEFLMVYFAVCACASGLLPAASDRSFPGIEYYEKALLLYYASPGQASLESVQCLGLLAICAASWNTLTQSWNLAGQAVRSAVDIGLHLGGRINRSSVRTSGGIAPVEILRQQIARRTWWSIYCQERVVSICLGRPMAVDEKDCSCRLPLDMSDEDLERYCHNLKGNDSDSHSSDSDMSRPLTGFLAFARLCRISGRIQQLGSPVRLRQLSSFSPRKTRKYLSRVSSLDSALREWLETLPDSIRFSANALERRAGGDPGLVMCVIIFIVHAGALLNLYRYLAHDPTRTGSMSEAEVANARPQCISAARSCINAAELVRDLVPPSHYLAICVHCLTLSGVALLRMSVQPPDPRTIADAEKCVRFLKDLEFCWSGAGRSRAIIEQLLVIYREKPTTLQPCPPGTVESAMSAGGRPTNHKRSFTDLEDDSGTQTEETYWREVPWLDILHFDDGTGLPGAWGVGA